MSMPIMFMISIVGLSPKKFEIGGVAPMESPAAMVMTGASAPPERWASAVYVSNHGLRNAAPPMPKAGLTPGAARLSAASVSGVSWPW